EKVLTAVMINQNYRLRLRPADGSEAQMWGFEEVNDNTAIIFNKMVGTKKVITVSKEGKNNQLKLARRINGGDESQQWTAAEIEDVDGDYFRLMSVWLGNDRSIDIVNDENDDRVKMAPTNRWTGQYWTVQELSSIGKE
ncbi:MAG: hypothetical protein AAFV80_23795, partial [Bacteroidota bacterium]